MKILIATDFDNGGQMIALCKALNKYTKHEARLITFRKTFLNYEEDVFNPTPNEVHELVNRSDFYILGEMLMPNIQSHVIYHALTVNNSILRAGGSTARSQPTLYSESPIMKAGGFHDPTIALNIGPMAVTVNMCHFDEWPVSKKGWEPPFKLVFSGTPLKHRADHSSPIKEAWDRLADKYGPDTVEFVNICLKPWAESVKIKSECHICYDQMKIGTYANSAIEGMYYRMPVFCYQSGWSQACFPDVPVIPTRSADEIFRKTVEMIENPDEMMRVGNEGHDYVMRVHDAKNAVKRWEGLIRYVSEEYKR